MSKIESSENNKLESADRREAVASLLKYSIAVGGASTVALSAPEAVAKSSASGCARQNPGNAKCVGNAPYDGERGEVPSGRD